MTAKKFLKVVFISFVAIIIRSILQLIIPTAEQTVFDQSVFVKNGTLPLVFMIYGTVAFSAITIIFLLIQRGMGGSRISKGLKTGFIFTVVWTIFLVEPLPHGSTIDLFSYPLVDGAVLILLGIMSGRFLSENSENIKHKLNANSIFNISVITLFFTIGRMIEYKVFDIYSMYEQAQLETIVWVICAGIIIGLMFEFIKDTITNKNTYTKTFMFGGFIFGINLFFFNFFLPLVLDVDILDLVTRTLIDIISVTIGCLIINVKEQK
ncbi:MAG: hypothetical protein K0R18_1793 [Bacillales bacterium]|jgi:hypothetical protein|nr:hypothetical protein [Bacillales bacterium]